MKRIKEMSDEELLALTEEDISFHIKFTMAERGIPIFPPPDKVELIDVETEGEQFYKCEDLFSNLLFRSAEDAQKVLNLFEEIKVCRFSKDWNEPEGQYIEGYKSHDYSGEPKNVEIASVKVRDKKSFEELQNTLKENKKRNTAYDNELKKFRESQKGSNDCRDDVLMPIEKARTRQRDKKIAKNRMEEYMSLANDNFSQAIIFFQKAYTPDEDVDQYLHTLYDVRVPEEMECETAERHARESKEIEEADKEGGEDS